MLRKALHFLIGPPLPDHVFRTVDEVLALEVPQQDLLVEALIREVDPAWRLGLPRAHINLIPDPVTGNIYKAELCSPTS